MLKILFYGNPFDFYAESHNIIKPTFGSTSEIWQAYKVVNRTNVRRFIIDSGFDAVVNVGGGIEQIIVFNSSQISIINGKP